VTLKSRDRSFVIVVIVVTDDTSMMLTPPQLRYIFSANHSTSSASKSRSSSWLDHLSRQHSARNARH
jgi:hypothetical protein